jgi:hypothetical protein
MNTKVNSVANGHSMRRHDSLSKPITLILLISVFHNWESGRKFTALYVCIDSEGGH